MVAIIKHIKDYADNEVFIRSTVTLPFQNMSLSYIFQAPAYSTDLSSAKHITCPIAELVEAWMGTPRF